MSNKSRLFALLFAIVGSGAALAGPADKVYAPFVVKGETEFELRGGYRDFDGAPSTHAFVFDVGRGITDRWKTELVLEYAGGGGERGKLEAVEWENILVLTEQGKYWADVGLFAEYEHVFGGGPDEIKIGPLFQKEFGPAIANLNLVFERQVGSGASTDIELDYAWQVKWRGKESLQWGLQGFGGLGAINHLGAGDKHSLGPAIFGVKRLAGGRKVSFDAAVLAGLNDAAPDVTVRFQLEYEIY
ncbi:MAG: hypothetical protein ABIQ97_02700 [Lysobacteraceae bacterium]